MEVGKLEVGKLEVGMLKVVKLDDGKLVSWKLGKVDTPVCHVVPELWRGPRRSGTRGAGGALRGAKRRAAVRASEECDGADDGKEHDPRLLCRDQRPTSGGGGDILCARAHRTAVVASSGVTSY